MMLRNNEDQVCYHIWVKGSIGLSICYRCGKTTAKDTSDFVEDKLFMEVYRKFNGGNNAE